MPSHRTRWDLSCVQCGNAFVFTGHRPPMYCTKACRYGTTQKRLSESVALPNGAVQIPLRKKDGSVRAYVIVDAADAEWACQWRWHWTDGYATRNVKANGRYTGYCLHRELMGVGSGDAREVDHRDRDRLNCRRENLRVLTKPENAQNRPSYRGASSRFRGVGWDRKANNWRAYVRFQGKQQYLGNFENEEIAAEVARAARTQLLPCAVD